MKPLVFLFIVTLAGIGVVFHLSGLPVTAQTGINPGSVETTVYPGVNDLGFITVSNNSNNKAYFEVTVADYGQDSNGTTLVIESGTSSFSAAGFISAEPSGFTVDPGGRQEIRLTADVPGSVSGGKYAIVLISNTSYDEEALKIVSRLGVLVRLSPEGISGHNGSLINVKAEMNETADSIVMTSSFFNTGNIHSRIRKEYSLLNESGELAGVEHTKPYLVLPGYFRSSIIELHPESSLQPGTYTLAVQALLEDGTTVAKEQIVFDVAHTLTDRDVSSGFDPAGFILAGIIMSGLLLSEFGRKHMDNTR